MADEDLSNEQLRQLLKDAEQRLRSKGNDEMIRLPSSIQDSIPTVASGSQIKSYIIKTDCGAQVDRSHTVKRQERVLANGIRIVEDPAAVKTKAEQTKKATAGSDWYNLPKTNLTQELKRDLQLLKMRDTIDPKRFYKKDNKKPQVPEFSQVGTIIEGSTEFFSARLSNKDRKRTFVEEVLKSETASGRFKSKYNEIQAAKTSGKKAHYKKMKAVRRGGVSKG